MYERSQYKVNDSGIPPRERMRTTFVKRTGLCVSPIGMVALRSDEWVNGYELSLDQAYCEITKNTDHFERTDMWHCAYQ